MAVGRGGASSSATLAIAFLATGFVVCLLLAILFFTQLGGAQQDLAEAEDRLAEVVSRGEFDSPEVQARRDGAGSVVGRLLADLSERDGELTAQQTEVGALRSQIAEKDTSIAALTDSLEAARAEARRASEGLEAARGEFRSSTSGLNERLSESTSSLGSVNASAREKLDNLVAQATEERNRLTGQLDEREAELRATREQLADLRDKYERLAQQEDVAVSKVTQADARVVEVMSGGRKVALDIGSRSRVPLGLTFRIYDADRLVKLDGDDETPAKAVVEVFELFEDTAIARVTELARNAKLIDGDKAVNLVFDADRTFRFHVYGDFDIDGKGEGDPREKRRVEAMVSQWGGEVAGELGFDVDYLVLGTPPELPRELVGQEVSDRLKIEEFNEARQRFEDYQRLVEEARQFDIPVLNQNRFLDLIGYYER